MSYHRHYRLNADEVAVILALVDAELEASDWARNSINEAIEFKHFEEDTIADARYLARLGRITQILQEGQDDRESYNWARDHEINHHLAALSRDLIEAKDKLASALRDLSTIPQNAPQTAHKPAQAPGTCACGSGLIHAECCRLGHPR